MELIFSKLKFSKHLALLITFGLLVSCRESISNQAASSESFKEIENELKNKFGNNAYYTDLSITYKKTLGNIIDIIVTENPESLKMEQWNLTQDNWKQTSEITLQVPSGSKASDFMFQLNESINLSTLGNLIEASSKKLTETKKIENPILHLASVKFPRNGDDSKTEYVVMLQPEHGGTTFTFSYHLNGKLIKMDD